MPVIDRTPTSPLRPPRRRRIRDAGFPAVPVLLTTLVAAGASLALGGCGGDDDRATTRATTPTLPFPPAAYEPATSRGGGPKPAGRVIRIGGQPEGVAVEPRSGLVGVALRDRAHSFAIIDPSTLRVRRTVPLLADPRHVGVAGGRFLVPMEDADRLAEIPATGGEPRVTKVGDEPHAVAAADGAIYVADEYADQLSVVRDGRLVGTAQVDVQPGGTVDVGRGQLAVVSVRANTIELVDTKTLRSGPSQSAGYGPSHAVADPATGRVYVADTRGGAILSYDTRPRLRALHRLALGGSPYGIAIDVARSRLWVADSGADRLDEIALEGNEPRRVRSFATVRQPNTIAVEPKTGAVFVASEAAGQLQRVAP